MDKFSILDIVIIFLKHKKFILFTTILALIVSAVLYFAVFDLIYLSESSIKSSSKPGGFLSALEGSLPDLDILDDATGGSSRSYRELANYQEILISRKCLEPFITFFNIMQEEDIKYKEDAFKFVREDKIRIEIDRKSGLLFIGVYDKSPDKAKEMVGFLLDELNKINIELNITNAKNNREFIEKRYFNAKEDLSKAEDSLKSFQLIYGIAPDLQIKASAQTAFAIESELKAEEVKLDVLKKILNSDQPEVKTQEAKVNSLKLKVIEIQNSTDISDLLKLGNSPQILLNYLRLQREVEIQTKIITFLLPVYEQAKIEEKRDTPTILILDKPYIPDKKSKPKRLTMTIIFTICGFVCALIISGLKEHYKFIKKNNPEKLNYIIETFQKKI